MRVEDDPHEACRIQDALLQVELPGSVLLCEKPALQAIGEPSDNSLQMR